jgi:hypothetical protein
MQLQIKGVDHKISLLAEKLVGLDFSVLYVMTNLRFLMMMLITPMYDFLNAMFTGFLDFYYRGGMFLAYLQSRCQDIGHSPPV